jgi:hypothetical protein
MNDFNVLQSAVSILKATGRFQSIRLGRLEQPIANPTGAHVIIQRVGFHHDIRQGAMDTLERRVRFRIDLRYYNPDPSTRSERIIGLEASIFNSLNNVSIGGMTIPARTTVEAGLDNLKEDLQPGMSQVMIDGYFAYAVDPTDGLTT